MTAPALNFTAVDLAIAKLDLAPADILVAKVSIPITADVRECLASYLKTLRSDGGKVMVLDGMIDVSVVKAVQS